MKNVDMSIDNDILTIKVDLSKNYGPSKSGKTIIIATTEGNAQIADREEVIGMNIYKRP